MEIQSLQKSSGGISTYRKTMNIKETSHQPYPVLRRRVSPDFETQEYRDTLATLLSEEPDHHVRKEFIAFEKQTRDYKLARKQTIDDRRILLNNQPRRSRDEIDADDIFGHFILDTWNANVRRLSQEEITKRINTIRKGETAEEDKRQAREEISNSFLRAIIYSIKKTRQVNVPPEEYIAYAYNIVNRCIDSYRIPQSEEENRKNRFKKYVFISLRKGLRTFKTRDDVRYKFSLPVAFPDTLNYMSKAWEQFMQEHEREPHTEELYEATKTLWTGNNKSPFMAFDRFVALKTHGIDRPYISLGKPVGTGRINSETAESLFGDIEDTLADDFEIDEIPTQHILALKVDQSLNTLSPQQRDVMRQRFGIGDKDNVSKLLEEVGITLGGITRERVRQIESKALRMLRHPSRSRRLREFYGLYESKPEREHPLASYEREVEKRITAMAKSSPPQKDTITSGLTYTISPELKDDMELDAIETVSKDLSVPVQLVKKRIKQIREQNTENPEEKHKE